ncbi:MAG: putative periplasmic lipoprotein [Planctomycetota bacterium]
MTTTLARRLLVVLSACLLLTACASRGPGRLPPDRFNYNAAIAQSANEQMLLNLVRLRYSEIPVFLDVSSVLTQYRYMGSVGVSGSSGESLGDPSWSVGGSANIRYLEQPTITYTPLKGGEFAEQLIEPIPTEMVFSLVESGWPPEELMVMCFYRVNHLVNVPFDAELEEGETERLRAFRTAMEQMIELARLSAVETERREREGEEIRVLIFNTQADPQVQARIDAFKSNVGLDPAKSDFEITRKAIRRGPDMITVRVRSLLELMGFLSHGVEVPAAHLEEKRVRPPAVAVDNWARTLIPLHVQSSAEPPEGAYVAVRHQDHWFYIAHDDHTSKQSFGLLGYLFQMQSPQQKTVGPILTVPTG